MTRRAYDVPLPDGRVLCFADRTLVMGVLNVTPDSFSDGGRYADAGAAVDHGLAMIAAGADVLDVGGESTRPGAEPVPAAEEQARVLPVIRALAQRAGVPISIDTYKSEVARAAIDAGATIVNDISGLQYDPALATVAARAGTPLVLMHTRGRPSNMYGQAVYDSVVADVVEELARSMIAAMDAGVAREVIVLDPGLGFGKRAAHSLTMLARLDDPALLALDRPLLVGASRKSFLKGATGPSSIGERDWATAAAVTTAVLFGAHMVRVHRVAEMAEVVRVADLLRQAR